MRIYQLFFKKRQQHKEWASQITGVLSHSVLRRKNNSPVGQVIPQLFGLGFSCILQKQLRLATPLPQISGMIMGEASASLSVSLLTAPQAGRHLGGSLHSPVQCNAEFNWDCSGLFPVGCWESLRVEVYSLFQCLVNLTITGISFLLFLLLLHPSNFRFSHCISVGTFWKSLELSFL